MTGLFGRGISKDYPRLSSLYGLFLLGVDLVRLERALKLSGDG